MRIRKDVGSLEEIIKEVHLIYSADLVAMHSTLWFN